MSTGAVARTDADRAAAHAVRLRNYFYGQPSAGGAAQLSPHSVEVGFDAVEVYRLSEAPPAPATALPLGTEFAGEQLLATRLVGGQLAPLVHSLLAVVRSPSGSCDDLLAAPLAGVVLVSAVDLERQRITLLSPSPLPLPSMTLLAGSLRWSGA
ncbi:hypothetical protein EMIHUDRAFT_420773 [Emiliania huxleyi CCMP1516]|uniref:Clp1 C-terminal domain-containing protein n=2 Tax=Emiliania huxleyi TaxID=2903 RepID=A0A0D3KUW4_EMIH1|nr:hypothetical protein EMIHUDRAFT_420773 [Emiliania huxleyi CCMP1516]EOD39549.1 hypothetical protein EMIHUDRAFT_420773 [Emiliania huxleyi CCMP1516]|eukprot:XP_005791978.1 hypothetical protein EMIHUDRAFT_420773 [Emiliania huxleyi CCMP1516]